jgi:ABC-type spermidine/putrescine transport system permease subunit II
MGDSRYRIGYALVMCCAVAILVYLIVPTLVIIPISLSSSAFLEFPPPGFSLRWFQAFFESQEYREAIFNSLRIGVPAAFFATVLGLLAALALVRGRVPGARMLSSMLIAPLVLPQIILAIGLYPIMVALGIIGTYPAILIGHTVVTMPLSFIILSAALRSYPPSFELASMTLGANPFQTFCYVTFPMIRIPAIVGFIFCFAFSFDELILAMFLTSPSTRTVPRLLWDQLNYEMTPVIAAATVILMCITLALLLAAALVARRGGREFKRIVQ